MKERTNQRDSGGKINTKAYEDTEGWREGEGVQRHGLLQRVEAEDEGSGGRGEQRRARGAVAVKGQRTLAGWMWWCWDGGGGGGEGCEGDVLTQPSVSWG